MKLIGFALATVVLMAVFAVTVSAAGIDGKWNFGFIHQGTEYPRVIELTLDGEKVTGRLGDEVYTGTLKNGAFELSGEHYAQEAGHRGLLKLSGRLEGGEIKGEGSWDAYPLTFVAKRAE